MLIIHSMTRSALLLLGLLCIHAFAGACVAQAEQRAGRLSPRVMPDRKDGALTWESRVGPVLQIGSPRVTAALGGSHHALSVDLVSHSTSDAKAEVDYRISLKRAGEQIDGTYRVECLLSNENQSDLLVCRTQFGLSQPVQVEITVQQPMSVLGEAAQTITLPERGGIVRTRELAEGHEAFFPMARAVERNGSFLAMPVIGLELSRSSFAVSADPYNGVSFAVKPLGDVDQEGTQLMLTTKYSGSITPVLREERTIAMEFHRRGIDGMLRNFYHTIPDIKPGPAWIHDIQLTFYDYIAETGTSLEPDLEALAERIPQEFRKNVLVCLHGYYDYLGRYSFNHRTKSFDDEWDAYDDKARHLAMTKEDLHRRLRLVKSHGFRSAIYFADALAYDRLIPEFNEEWIWRDENREPVRWWYWQKRPDKKGDEKNYALDPSHPEVREWFIDYTAAYVKEFGRDLDALVWDETHCVVQDSLAWTSDGIVAADRAMMNLVADITREVQRNWVTNPDLAFLLSDNLHMMKPGKETIPFCLVAHGTYQDSQCNPNAWAPGMIPNYRNCLYSCNWRPVTWHGWNRFAVEQYGLPPGLGNGYWDDKGPAEMPEEMLDEIISLFMGRCRSGEDRTRYVLPDSETVFDVKELMQ